MASRPQLLSGARGIIQLGATPIAFVTDIAINVREGVRQTYVMGRMNAGAIDSLSYDVDVSVGRIVPVNAKDADANDGAIQGGQPGIAPRSSSATGIAIGLETIIAQMTSADDLSIVLQDRETTTIAHVHNCRFSGRSFTMNAGDVAQERYNFIGIYDSGYGASGEPGQTAVLGYDSSSA